MTEDNLETDEAHDLLANPALLDVLVCPITKTPLHYCRKNQELISKAINLAYPIRHGIPVMLVDEARPADASKPTPRFFM